MKNLSLFLLLFCSTEIFAQAKLELMPYPANVELTGSKFRLKKDFTIKIENDESERLFFYTAKALRRLSDRTGLFVSQNHLRKGNIPIDASLLISYKRIGELKIYEDESYELKISEDKINLSAETDIGIMRGLETLLQLISIDDERYYFPTLKIKDYPRFTWRGLMIDVSRHYMPLEVIKRNLDAMASVKLNVFHWHLADDQGFRVECKTWPKLHEIGSDGFYYTQEQIKEIIKYANDRGIRVIPEFDIPAHATSWCAAYPELASAPGPFQVEVNWGVFDPTLDPTKEFTYEFLDSFFKEMCALFNDEYMHIGGDENNGKQWNENEDIQKFMKDNNLPDNHSLQMYFNRRILDILTKYGKKMIGWDEIFHTDLPNNIVIHSWRGHKAMNESAKLGYQAILSNGYYIDLIQPAEFHYLNDPIPEDSPLNDDEKKNILGGEATSWGELITYETIDSRIWPRTIAIAERLWSPQNIRDVDDMYKRMERISFLMEEHGLLHIKNYEMMLRRLTNNNDITPLKIFVDVVEPVKFYQRHSQGIKYTSYSPLTRVVDAARPESMTARYFNKLVDEYIATKNEDKLNEIISYLEMWRDNNFKLKKIIQQSPILKEIETMADDLETISELGILALNILSRKVKDTYLPDSTIEILTKAKVPRGQVELKIVEPIEKIINEVIN